jgi:hypothetical protein
VIFIRNSYLNSSTYNIILPHGFRTHPRECYYLTVTIVLVSLKRRGVYVDGVLKLIETNFHLKVERIEFSPIGPLEVLQEVRYMLESYEVVIMEIEQELQLIGLEQFGNAACRMFYQMLEVIRYLIGQRSSIFDIPQNPTEPSDIRTTTLLS